MCSFAMKIEKKNAAVLCVCCALDLCWYFILKVLRPFFFYAFWSLLCIHPYACECAHMCVCVCAQAAM